MLKLYQNKGIDFSDVSISFGSNQGDSRAFEVGFNKNLNFKQSAHIGWALNDLGLTEVKRMVNGHGGNKYTVYSFKI